MKTIITFAACFFITVLLFLSCKKDKDQQTPPAPVNQPPVARAGADTTYTLSSCGAYINTTLDGSKSSDPENKIYNDGWRVISGQSNIPLFNVPNSLNALAQIRRPGVYNFELTIVDNGYLTSKDTVSITVIGSTPKEYDFDITSNTTYIFRDNYEDCDDGWGPCAYNDRIEIRGTGTFAPIGLLNIGVDELSDTANLSYNGASYFNIFKEGYTTTNLYGRTSINFKKLILQGGGAFTGNLNITDGSAKYCDENIYNSLAPLLVTGNLDTTTKKVSISIKGKVFF
jgi:hypothetical protein